MGEYIDIITLLKPKNDANLAVADVNDLKGGYILLDTLLSLTNFTSKYSNRLKSGMLCFLTSTKKFYLYLDGTWSNWKVESEGKMVLQSVSTLDDLDNDSLKNLGQVVYVDSIDGLRYYNGTDWLSFSRIYVQDTAPSDTNGIWIDTSEDTDFNNDNALVKSLISTINALSQKIERLEMLRYLISSGEFDHNMADSLDTVTTLEPDTSTLQEDDLTESDLENTLLDDSSEPTDTSLPDTYHLSCKWGTYANMVKYKDSFVKAELLWCYDKKQLWIKDPYSYQLILIGSYNSGTITTDITDDEMNGILQNTDKTLITGIEFVDMVNPDKTYLALVLNGELTLTDESLSTHLPNSNAQGIATDGYYSTLYEPVASGTSTSKQNPLVFINMIYAGGDSDETTVSPVNYNFIELCNLTSKDLYLNGLWLHYTQGDLISGTRYWVSLPLKGKIKAGSTFLIRGAKCGQDKFAKIKVGTPDQYFCSTDTLNNSVLNVNNTDIWDDEGLLKIAYNCSFFLSGPLYEATSTATSVEVTKTTLATTPLKESAPWKSSKVIYGFIDIAGFGTYGSTNIAMPGDKSTSAACSLYRLPLRYYNMDAVSQAYSAISARANGTDWTYINLDDTYQDIELEKYTPKNSTEGKSIFFNKHLLEDGVPTFVTCTFGFDPHTTRCFTWVNKGYRDEYIRYKKQGDTDWTVVESFKSGDGRSSKNHRDNSIYDRIRTVTTDGTYYTVHKVILDFPEASAGNADTYIYQVGYKNNWTDERTFKLRNRHDIVSNGFSFVQVTDQQGFNAEEYETWKLAAQYINANESGIDFTLNTGDATLNGNRINEWIDYFNAGESLFDHFELMYTVGNNDLCPNTPYILGDGSDTTKTNPINVQYFFTFEHPNEIPVSSTGVYIPCVYSFIYGTTYFLCMNSELNDKSNSTLFGESYIYSGSVKTWCDNDLVYANQVLEDTFGEGTTAAWKIAYCHEAPYTIITRADVDKYLTSCGTAGSRVAKAYSRGGSHLNTDGQEASLAINKYWFSKFLEDNGFGLCICGHKHTYANSRYIHDGVADSDGNINRMLQYIYDPAMTDTTVPTWYNELSDDEKLMVVPTNDKTKGYVKYVMCQATGYKLISNKELPAGGSQDDYMRALPHLLEYYPVTASSTVNIKQLYPNYIIWNIGTGTENEDKSSRATSRPRILGKSIKLWDSSHYTTITESTKWAFKYNKPVTLSLVSAYGGNGFTNNGDNYIIVDKIDNILASSSTTITNE